MMKGAQLAQCDEISNWWEIQEGYNKKKKNQALSLDIFDVFKVFLTQGQVHKEVGVFPHLTLLYNISGQPH